MIVNYFQRIPSLLLSIPIMTDIGVPESLKSQRLSMSYMRFNGGWIVPSAKEVLPYVTLLVASLQKVGSKYRRRPDVPIHFDKTTHRLCTEEELREEYKLQGEIKDPRFPHIINFFQPSSSFEKMFKEFFGGRQEPDRTNTQG